MQSATKNFLVIGYPTTAYGWFRSLHHNLLMWTYCGKTVEQFLQSHLSCTEMRRNVYHLVWCLYLLVSDTIHKYFSVFCSILIRKSKNANFPDVFGVSFMNCKFECSEFAGCSTSSLLLFTVLIISSLWRRKNLACCAAHFSWLSRCVFYSTRQFYLYFDTHHLIYQRILRDTSSNSVHIPHFLTCTWPYYCTHDILH